MPEYLTDTHEYVIGMPIDETYMLAAAPYVPARTFYSPAVEVYTPAERITDP